MEKLGKAAVALLQASRQLPSRALALPANTSETPALFDQTCDIELPRLLSAWIPDHGPREIRRALTATERAAVLARATALQFSLTGYLHGERNAVEADIAAMFGGFRAMRQRGDDAEATVAATAGVLRGFPAWAIREGCLKIARNQAGLDRRYAPNDTEVFSVIDGIVKDYRKRLAVAETLLAAPVAPPYVLPAPAKMEASTVQPIGLEPHARLVPDSTPDGKHAARVAADLAQRRARQAEPRA